MTHLQSVHTQSWQWCLFCCDYHTQNAQDILQEAYLRVLSGQAQFRAQSTVKTWFFGIIRLLSYNQKRTYRSRMKRLAEGVQSYVSLPHSIYQGFSRYLGGGSDQQLNQAVANEPHYDREQIQQAIETLSQAQKQVIILVFYQDLTLNECAEIMQISVGSVRTHYARAKKKLAHLLQVHKAHL